MWFRYAVLRPVICAGAALCCCATASAARHRSAVGEAKHIITQPGRDLGISKAKIPAVLKRAARAPYSRTGASSCKAINQRLSDLDDALGPDFGHRTMRRGSTMGTVARMGSTSVINSLIPFRGIVRQVSGAAAQQRRLAEAVNAGYARRGFLHGLSVSRHCE